MTDFLTRIARAALGLTPVVQVLGAPRYAPGRDLSALGAEAEAEEREVEAPAVESLPVARRTIAPSATAPVAAREPLRAIPAERLPQIERPPAAVRAASELVIPSVARDLGGGRRATRATRPLATLGVTDGEVEAVRVDQAVQRERPAEFVRTEPEESREATGEIEPAVAIRVTVPRVAAEARGEFVHEPGQPAVDVIEIDAASPPAREPIAVFATPSHSAAEVNAIDDRRPADAPVRTTASRPVVELAEVIEAVERSVRPRASVPVTATVIPSTRPFAEDAGAASDDAPPAPVIRVTIGRIDVRAAAPPPPPPAPPAPAAPRLSLDEYLRSHNGRTR